MGLKLRKFSSNKVMANLFFSGLSNWGRVEWSWASKAVRILYQKAQICPERHLHLLFRSIISIESSKKYVHAFAGIDATHNTTHYENTNLFTVIVRDKWGYGKISAQSHDTWANLNDEGFLVALMISSNTIEATIDYFFTMLWEQNQDVIPAKMMTYCDKGQLKAIWHCYTEAQVCLCCWHVLHAWQDHFITHHFPKLWGLLKGCIWSLIHCHTPCQHDLPHEMCEPFQLLMHDAHPC